MENLSTGEIHERKITQHLETIDSALIPLASKIAQSRCKDLSTPEKFIRKKDTIKPEDLALVHLTDTFPKNGIIHPSAFYDPDSFRFTTHTAVNATAPDINIWGFNWQDRRYAVLIPFDKVKDKVLAFNPADTFFLEDLTLPEGSVILKDKNETLDDKPSGQAQVAEVDYSQSGKRLTGFQRAVYEKMIQMGYFPQVTSEVGEWIGWGANSTPVWREFCRQNNIEYLGGNPHASHWTGQMEETADSLDYFRREGNEHGFQEVATNARELLERTDVPLKYRQKLLEFIKQYKIKFFPDAEIPELVVANASEEMAGAVVSDTNE